VDVYKRVKLEKNSINGFRHIAVSSETGRGGEGGEGEGGERGGGGGGGTRMNQKQYVSPERGET
jgi:hypothetical protein